MFSGCYGGILLCLFLCVMRIDGVPNRVKFKSHRLRECVCSISLNSKLILQSFFVHLAYVYNLCTFILFILYLWYFGRAHIFYNFSFLPRLVSERMCKVTCLFDFSLFSFMCDKICDCWNTVGWKYRAKRESVSIVRLSCVKHKKTCVLLHFLRALANKRRHKYIMYKAKCFIITFQSVLCA